MDATLAAVGIGAVAGLAVAMPVGPVAVLLLREGMVHGPRRAAAGATGIATVDTAYAVLAVLVGVPVADALAGHASALRLIGAVLLGGVGLHGLLREVGPWSRARRASPVPPAVSGTAGGWRTCGRFAALTAVNPLTALTFAMVAITAVAGLGGSGGLGGVDPRQLGAAFVAGVGAASLSWHLLVAAGAGALGRRLGPRGRRLTGAAGSVTVVVLALVLAAG